MFDKNDIIDISRKINAYETSILPYEDCCTVFTPKHPNTKPVLEKIKKSESLLDLEPMMERALEGVETVVVKRFVFLFWGFCVYYLYFYICRC